MRTEPHRIRPHRIRPNRFRAEERPYVRVRVKDFDHLVLNVQDVERSLEFYCGLLGLEPIKVDEWRAGEFPFPSVRVSPTMIIDLLGRSRHESNVDHICLV